MSGQRPRIRAVAAAPEEFREPELDLVASAWAALDAPDPAEFRAALALLTEREKTIVALGGRIESLESTVANLLATLRAREAQLEELRELWLPTPVAPVADSSHSGLRAQTPPSNATTPAQLATNDDAPALQPALPSRLKGVSLALNAASELERMEFGEDAQLFAGLAESTAEGVFLPTYRETAVGTEVELQLELSDAVVVRLNGVVTWLRDATSPDAERPGWGIAWRAPSSAALEVITGLSRALPLLYIEF